MYNTFRMNVLNTLSNLSNLVSISKSILIALINIEHYQPVYLD